MPNLNETDLTELVERYNYLIKQYVPLAAEIAPKLDKFGKLRQELQVISSEFVKRGYKPEEPDSLLKMVEEELKKRNLSVDGVTQTDTNQRNSESRKDSQ